MVGMPADSHVPTLIEKVDLDVPISQTGVWTNIIALQEIMNGLASNNSPQVDRQYSYPKYQPGDRFLLSSTVWGCMVNAGTWQRAVYAFRWVKTIR
jgi:hypothetical protein